MIWEIIVFAWLGAAILLYLHGVLKAIAVKSTHKRYRFIRKMFWNTVIQDRLIENIDNYKVKNYFRSYLDKSLAAREYYLTHGFKQTSLTLIGKIEELERFVDKWKFNTFDSLDPSEEDFIDRHNKTRGET